MATPLLLTLHMATPLPLILWSPSYWRFSLLLRFLFIERWSPSYWRLSLFLRLLFIDLFFRLLLGDLFLWLGGGFLFVSKFLGRFLGCHLIFLGLLFFFKL